METVGCNTSDQASYVLTLAAGAAVTPEAIIDVIVGRQHTHGGPSRSRVTTMAIVAAAVSALLVMATLTSPLRAYAAIVPTIGLGTAKTYSVLAGSTVTNTGPSVLDGDVGVSPGTAVVGLTRRQVGGTIHRGDAAALKAKDDLVTAYDDAAGRVSNAQLAVELGGKKLIGGVYNVTTEAQITGTLTLDGQNNPNSVWIFQVPTTLITATNSSVNLINGASSCNVFWQVGSSATIGVGSDFVGTVMALASVSVQTGTTVAGRALARNAAVTLDNNVFTSTRCRVAPLSSPSPSPSPSGSGSPSVTPTGSTSPSTSPSASPTATATESETESPSATVTATESETESTSATATVTRSASATTTATESETESSSTTTGATLANTGSDGFTSLLAVGGGLAVLIGGTLLALARSRSRYRPRH